MKEREKLAKGIASVIDSLPMSWFSRMSSKLATRFLFPAVTYAIRHTPRAVNRRAVILTDWSTKPEESILRKCCICGEDVWIPLDWLPSAVYGPWPEHKACTERSDYAEIFRHKFGYFNPLATSSASSASPETPRR